MRSTKPLLLLLLPPLLPLLLRLLLLLTITRVRVGLLVDQVQGGTVILHGRSC